MAVLRQLARRVCLLLLTAQFLAASEGGPVDEDQVKAIFLYKVVRFVEWPSSAAPGAEAPLLICVVGDDAFSTLLEQVAGSRAAETPRVEVARVSDAAAYRKCHVLYFAASERRRLRESLATLAGAPVLTAGEREGFALQGCVLDMWVEANRIRFAVNTAAAARAQLRISSKLLALAARVIKE